MIVDFCDGEEFIQSAGSPVDENYIDDMLFEGESSAISDSEVFYLDLDNTKFDSNLTNDDYYMSLVSVVKNTGTECDFLSMPKADVDSYMRGSTRVCLGKLKWMKEIVRQNLDEFDLFCDELFLELKVEPTIAKLEKLFLVKSKGGRSPPPSVIGARVAVLLTKAHQQGIINRFVLKLEFLMNLHYRQSRQRRVIKLIIDHTSSFYQHLASNIRDKFWTQIGNRHLDQHKLCGPLLRHTSRVEYVRSYLDRYLTDEFPMLWSDCNVAAKKIRNGSCYDDDYSGYYSDLLRCAEQYGREKGDCSDWSHCGDVQDDLPLPYNCTVAQQVEVMRGTLIAGSGNGNSQRRRRQKKSNYVVEEIAPTRSNQNVKGRQMVIYQPPSRPLPPKPRVAQQQAQSSWSAPDVGAGLGGMIGNAIVPGVGGLVGGLLGRAGGWLFKSISGHGAYTVQQNSLVGSNNKIASFGDGSSRVKYRDFIGSVNSTVAFTNTSYSINAGNQQLFPWLSLRAQGYEQYRFDGLVFEYIATSANALNSTNTALGQVIQATDYNPANVPFASEQQMLSTIFSTFGAPSVDLIHPIECAIATMQSPWLNVRTGSVPATGNVGLYDYGVFQIATVGSQAAAQVGQLFVSYDCVFQKPILPDAGGGLLVADHYSLVSVSVGAAYFGTTRVLQPGSNLGSTVTGTSVSLGADIQFGHYMIAWSCTGTGAAGASITITPTNCSLTSSWNNATATVVSTGTSTVTSAIYNFVINVTAANPSFVFSVGTLPSPAAFGDLWIMAIPSALSTAIVEDDYETFKSHMAQYSSELSDRERVLDERSAEIELWRDFKRKSL